MHPLAGGPGQSQLCFWDHISSDSGPYPPTPLFSHKGPFGDIRPPWVTQETLYLPRPFIPPAHLFCQEGNRVTFLGIGTWRSCWRAGGGGCWRDSGDCGPSSTNPDLCPRCRNYGFSHLLEKGTEAQRG